MASTRLFDQVPVLAFDPATPNSLVPASQVRHNMVLLQGTTGNLPATVRQWELCLSVEKPVEGGWLLDVDKMGIGAYSTRLCGYVLG